MNYELLHNIKITKIQVSNTDTVGLQVVRWTNNNRVFEQFHVSTIHVILIAYDD